MTPDGRAAATIVSVAGRRLRVTHLDKVLYPLSGTTKAQVMQYLTAVAPAILHQLRDRPVTRVRWPHGTGEASFFEKNTPAGAPSWVRRVQLPVRAEVGADTIDYPIVGDLADLIWLANASALELHVPQWRVGAEGRPQPPDRLVIDLDPGPPAGLTECAQVALLVRAALAGMLSTRAVPVTSGGAGMQIYVDTPGWTDPEATRAVAQALAEHLAADHPDLVVARMTTSLRAGRVLLDWSQNTRAKTTICPYSLRGRGGAPTVAAPRQWAEIEAAAASAAPILMQLSPPEVVDRLTKDGDLMRAPSREGEDGDPRGASGG